jgi:hypothetical protein
LSIFRRASRPTAREAVWGSIPARPGQVGERRPGDPVGLGVAVEGQPDRQLGARQLGHAFVDEGVY